MCGHTRPREPRYQVTYHTYLASRRWLSYTVSVKHIVGWKYAKHSLLVLQIFTIVLLRHAHVRKNTRLSPLFRTASDRKLGGNKTILTLLLPCPFSTISPSTRAWTRTGTWTRTRAGAGTWTRTRAGAGAGAGAGARAGGGRISRGTWAADVWWCCWTAP